MIPRDTRARYAGETSEEALARQRELAKDHFVCCGEPKETGHHESCSKRPPDDPLQVIPGQASLL